MPELTDTLYRRLRNLKFAMETVEDAVSNYMKAIDAGDVEKYEKEFYEFKKSYYGDPTKAWESFQGNLVDSLQADNKMMRGALEEITWKWKTLEPYDRQSVIGCLRKLARQALASLKP